MMVWDSLRKEGKGGAVGGRLSCPDNADYYHDLIGNSPSSLGALADPLWLRRGSLTGCTKP